MYGKIFDSMYKGTMYGHWEAIVTFQQMIVLSDSEGIVDYTPMALSATTSIPIEIITKGIEILSRPDPYSRTPGNEGKRIELLDSHRNWGWKIVNHKYYRDLSSKEDKKEKDKLRISLKREEKKANKINNVADCSILSQNVESVVNVAYTNTDTNTDTNTEIYMSKPVGLVPYEKIVDLYIKHLPRLAGVAKITDKRKRGMKSIWNGDPGLNNIDGWEDYFKYINTLKFLMGDSPGNNWKADFDFVTKYENFLKIVEGKYS
jgi:hypothetical protein